MVRDGAARAVPGGTEREAEALRRRLYAPDASAADVARYRAVAGTAERVPPEPALRAAVGAADTAPAPAPRRSAGGIAAVVVAVLVLAVGAAVVRAASAGPTESLPAPRPLATDAVDRTAFVQDLDLGGQAGISAYLVTHGSPPGLRGATRFDTIERNGRGPASLDLTPVPPEAVGGGRATVLLVLATTDRAVWSTLRREVDSSGQQQDVRQVRRGGEQAAGVLTATTFRYGAGNRPVRLRLDVPAGTRWGAAVVFSD